MRRATACLLIFWAATAVAQQPNFGDASAPAHQEFVTFLTPEPVNVIAHKPAVVTLQFHVAQGYHINSHRPHAKELIPTQLAVEEMPGISVVSVDFPVGTDYSFSFMPKEKLSVYAGEFVLKAHLIAGPGDHPIHALLRYQACDATACYPPKTIPASFEVIAK